MNTGKTANISSYYSSEEVARLLGVNVATVKRWTDAGKLDCVKTAGGHRKFLLRHIAAFAREHTKYAQRLSVLPIESNSELELSSKILDADFDALIPVVLELAINCEYDNLQSMLNGIYLVHQDLPRLYDELLTPVLHHVGDLWEAGSISVGQEHLASQAIRDCSVKLQEVVNKEATGGVRALVLTLQEELHDIAAKFVQHILEVKGFQTLYSGQSTPASGADAVFETYRPERVYLSSSYITDPDSARGDFRHLLALCDRYGATLFVGGAGVALLDVPAERDIPVLQNFHDVALS